jgi:NAD(P)-dependent dehydrogenase (short-subunit alcohol dehydrogenase family)
LKSSFSTQSIMPSRKPVISLIGASSGIGRAPVHLVSGRLDNYLVVATARENSLTKLAALENRAAFQGLR